jgi:hypothetical protein
LEWLTLLHSAQNPALFQPPVMACLLPTHASQKLPTGQGQPPLQQQQLPESQCYLRFAASSSPALPLLQLAVRCGNQGARVLDENLLQVL